MHQLCWTPCPFKCNVDVLVLRVNYINLFLLYYIILKFVYFYLPKGMDAQVAYGFHHLRNEKPYLAQGPVANKVHHLHVYSGMSA